MSRLFSKTLFLVLFTISFIQSIAQVPAYRDTLLYFKAEPAKFYEPGDLNALKGTFVTLPNVGKVKAMKSIEAQKFNIPISSKVISDDVILFNSSKCYRFRTKNGRLIWVDRNRDGKIQPLGELRSIGPNGKPSKVYVEEVSCK